MWRFMDSRTQSEMRSVRAKRPEYCSGSVAGARNTARLAVTPDDIARITAEDPSECAMNEWIGPRCFATARGEEWKPGEIPWPGASKASTEKPASTRAGTYGVRRPA